MRDTVEILEIQEKVTEEPRKYYKHRGNIRNTAETLETQEPRRENSSHTRNISQVFKLTVEA